MPCVISLMLDSSATYNITDVKIAESTQNLIKEDLISQCIFTFYINHLLFTNKRLVKIYYRRLNCCNDKYIRI